MNRLVVDAHALLWFVEDNPKLSEPAAAALLDPAALIYFPVIALAEVLLVIEKGKASVDKSALLAAMRADRRISLMPLIRGDVLSAMELKSLAGLHDRFIVASARRVQIAGSFGGLITADEEIRAAGLVPVVW
jgi:PIN domain nuclease of toxin-antitoxin system